ncbi:hypothetical protein JVU11DRAFT_8618 [Chiua virens]|nr:hypothetical protein JVU11DRAFT_8618 [Chiua virens]
MADLALHPSVSQSSIPIVSPRPSRSSISSAFPLSQSSLVSQFRRTSESTTQPNPVPAVTLPLPQSPVSSIPSFRSIRNLLPFAPARVSSANPPPSPAPKPSFVHVSFGSLRRIANERKNSGTCPRPQEVEETPVIAIARPSESFEEEMMARKRSRDVNRSPSDPSPSSRTNDDYYVLPLPTPDPSLGADLSTIIEAENSGISKHLPQLGDLSHADGDDGLPISPFNPEQDGKTRIPSPDSRATSVLDLSTSKLAAEVMHALKTEDSTTASEWLQGVNGIVVEEGADDVDPFLPASGNALGGDEPPDATLDLGTLDPDLAQLLSPHRINGKSQSPSPSPSRIPSRTHSRSPSHPVSSLSLRPPAGDEVLPRTSPRLGVALPPSVSRTLVQSSPTRRSASLSGANATRGLPSSFLPRPMRSVTTASPSKSILIDGSSTASTLRGLPQKRHQPPSPLSSQTPFPPGALARKLPWIGRHASP